ncbi:MAG: ABC transporter permease [Gaiellaceae bacterium]
MAGYLIRRLLLTASVVAAVSLAAFIGFGLSLDPSYPLVFKPRDQAFVRATYHLRDPILVRYWDWVSNLFHHGFGTTVSTDVGGAPPHFLASGIAIGPTLLRAAEISAALVALSLVLVSIGSALVGVVAAERRRLKVDVGARGLAYLGAAVPTFLIGDLLRRATVAHQSFRIIGNKGYLTSSGSWFVIGPPGAGLVDWIRHLALPAIALALGLIGVYARYIRTSMMVELGKPYVTVARAKGLTERRVLVRHALRNSLVPVASLLSLEIGGIVGASLAADGVFDSGGLASVFLGALGHADPFELTAIVVTSAVVVCGFALVGDVLVGLLDPRLSFR